MLQATAGGEHLAKAFNKMLRNGSGLQCSCATSTLDKVQRRLVVADKTKKFESSLFGQLPNAGSWISYSLYLYQTNAKGFPGPICRQACSTSTIHSSSRPEVLKYLPIMVVPPTPGGVHRAKEKVYLNGLIEEDISGMVRHRHGGTMTAGK